MVKYGLDHWTLGPLDYLGGGLLHGLLSVTWRVISYVKVATRNVPVKSKLKHLPGHTPGI